MSKFEKGIPLSEEQKFYWLQLIRTENIGSSTFWSLIKNYQCAKEAIKILPFLTNRFKRDKFKPADPKKIEKEMQEAQKMEVHFVCMGEPEYPTFLKHIDCPPPIISVRGDLSILQKTAISIVGSRNSSSLGIYLASSFAKSLSESGFSIVSGFAMGIDTAAHQASLKNGTIAVLAGGVDNIYPPSNKKLYHEILDNGGAFISEMPLSFSPRAVDFPRRNRIIAGLSLGLLVVEAAKKSGSLITARLANEMGRTIFACPGSPMESRSKGTNDLIKSGAILATEPSDIVDVLAPMGANEFIAKKSVQSEKNRQLNFFKEDLDKNFYENSEDFFSVPDILLDNEKISSHFFGDENKIEQNTIKFSSFKQEDLERIISALSSTPTDLETIAYCANVSPSQLHTVLFELELSGKITRHINGLVSLKLET